MEERPEVTISNPHASDRALDVVGDDAVRSARPLVIGGAGLLLLLVLLAGAAELWERRVAEQEERRLASVVDVEATARFGQHVTGLDPRTGDGLVVRHVGLRNNGPRDVTVLAAELGDLRLDQEVVVPAGQDVRLSLRWTGSCRSQPPLLATSVHLELDLRTGAGRGRAVVPLPRDEQPPAPQDARRACGYLPLHEAVTMQVRYSELVGDEVFTSVFLANARNSPVRLASVRVGDGLGVSVQTDVGDPVTLPLELPARSAQGRAEQRVLRLVVRVEDCGSVDRTALGDLRPEALDALTLELADGTENAAVTSLVNNPTPLLLLLAAAC